MLTDRTKIQAAVLGDLHARSTWEDRQRTWYLLRTSGLRRQNKPFPGAADLHFPLVDSSIEKLKPFYAQQIFASECLAAFVARDPQFAGQAAAAAYFLDYEFRQVADFETDYLLLTDMMLERGRAILKIFWDTEGDRIGFDPLSPQQLIVPSLTKDLQRAERVVQVLRLTEAQYRASRQYRQDEDLIRSIRGGSRSDSGSESLLAEKDRIEGITSSDRADEIILWEVYQKKGNEVFVDTMSPAAPEEAIRAKFKLPYVHERIGGKDVTHYPFVDLSHEIRDKGWYASRGVAELLAPFEASLCRMWNEKHDAMAFLNRPLYYSEREVPNTANISTVPGSILPFAIQPVPQNQPAVSWDQEMISTRMIAEQRVSMPDFGLTNQRNNPAARSGTSSRTATEVNALSGLMGMSADLRARITRKFLAKVYRMGWALIVQHRSARELAFLHDGRPAKITRETRSAEYFIQPSGSADGWNKEGAAQRAQARASLLGGNPFINQAELWKSVLEADDPRLVQRLYQDPGTAQQDQMEDQAQELSVLQMGFPARVAPGDDDAAHIQTIIAYLDQKHQDGEELTPVAKQAIDQHLAQHMQRLAAKDKAKARQLGQALKQKVQQWAQGAAANASGGIGGAGGDGQLGQLAAGEGQALPPEIENQQSEI